MADPVDHEVEWPDADRKLPALSTGREHRIKIKRESIPLIFVPGIMGTRLRLAKTNGAGKNAQGLPNTRWNPDKSTSDGRDFLWYLSGKSPTIRRALVIGPSSYNKDFLEVHTAEPRGNGRGEVLVNSYGAVLDMLDQQGWKGPLGKVFDLPVYAVGYNWTDTCINAGKALASRIGDIISECEERTGFCEKVIIITHSMGGLVTRSASELANARDKILGVVHGVQPVTGSTVAYWRCKAGFEGGGLSGNAASRILGNNGRNVTVILGNIPGGLELLPTKNYRTNAGTSTWLTVMDEGNTIVLQPQGDPYQDIYRERNAYWRLIDEDLLDPANASVPTTTNADDPDAIDASARASPWDQYLIQLSKAETFHNQIGRNAHPETYAYHGIGHPTADAIRMVGDSAWVRGDSYPTRGFRGYYTNAAGKDRKVVLEDPAGDGDGTVPTSSGAALDSIAKRPPRPVPLNVEHEPAYNAAGAQVFTRQAILAMCKKRLGERRGV